MILIYKIGLDVSGGCVDTDDGIQLVVVLILEYSWWLILMIKSVPMNMCC